MIHPKQGVCQPSNTPKKYTHSARDRKRLRRLLEAIGLPSDDQALSHLLICYENGLTFDQTVRAMLIMHSTTDQTICHGCSRRLGQKSSYVVTLDNAVMLLCDYCVNRGHADPDGAGAEIIRRAQKYIGGVTL